MKKIQVNTTAALKDGSVRTDKYLKKSYFPAIFNFNKTGG